MSEAMDLGEALAMARRFRLAEEAPAMLAALRKAQELLRDLEAPAHLDEGAALDDEMTAILARIDGTPTARAGVWRIITGTHCAELLYWSNASGWGSLAQSDGFTQAERKTVNLPIGGQWWFDDEGEPSPTAQPAPPTKGIAETVAMGLWRAKAAKEITARKAPKKFAPELAGIKWAAFGIACELRGLDPEFDPAGFMAAAGYPGDF